MAEKGRGGCAVAVIKFLFRFYAICVPARRGEGMGRARETMGRKEEDLMMMYRGRATERRENGHGRMPLTVCSLGSAEDFKYKES